jgi:rod shape-determining protein MreD
MRNAALLLAGFGLLLVQANLFRLLDLVGYPKAIPSLVLPLILFMGVHEYSIVRGAVVAFVLGYATDLIGIAPIGLYTFTYVAIFLLARAAGVRLAAQTRTMQVVLALAFAFVHSVMILVLVAIFGRDAYVPRALYPLALPHVLATGAVAPFVFHLAQRLQSAGVGGPRPESLGGRIG